MTGDLGGGRSARPADADDQLASLNLAIEELAKVEPELCHNGTQCVAYRVPPQDLAVGKTFRPRRYEVWGVQLLQ